MGMKRIFNETALNIEPLQNGFIVAYKKDNEEDGRIVVAYQLVSFDTETATNAPRSAYQSARFGQAYGKIETRLSNPFYWKTLPLADGGRLLYYPNGDLLFFNGDGDLIKKDSLVLFGEGPAEMVISKGNVWANFSVAKRIVCYNAKNLKEDLYIGGKSSEFGKLEGLSANGRYLYACDSEKGLVWRINTDDYSVEVEIEFGEPVYQYLIIGDYVLVRLESGIYSL